jgi:transcriptional regulator with XRE-family HTH domain
LALSQELEVVMDEELEPSAEATAEQLLGERLEHLFATIPSPSGGRWTNVEMAAQLADRGIETTPAYISMLRRGRRANPSLAILTGMAKVFAIPTAYFYDPEVADRLNQDLELLVAVRQAGMEKIALRASALSPRGLREIGRIVEAVRQIEGLDDDDEVT